MRTDSALDIAVILALETATGEAVQVEVNEAKTGLTLIDTTFNATGPNARTFMVSPVNGSAAATGLGIAGVDATKADQCDGRIDGGPIIGIKLTDRFFLQNATLEATLDISIDGAARSPTLRSSPAPISASWASCWAATQV